MELTVEDVLRIRNSYPKNLDLLKTRRLTGVSTDSRSVRPGQVFFALRGERFDGHTYLAQAIGGGAALCIVNEVSTADNLQPMVVVPDTTRALGELASIHRSKFSIPVLAIGGSNGKTTTKEMIATVLGTSLRVLKTEKNYNNNIGVPLTLFELNDTHEAAVVEIGTNHPGEITDLCRILRPTHGLVTNVGREHLEFFRTVRRVAAEEGALYSFLRRSGKGTALVNADDPWVLSAARGIRKNWKYGFDNRLAKVKGTIQAADSSGCLRFRFTAAGSKRGTSVQLAVPGLHNASNALAASTAGLAFGIAPERIRQALSHFGAVKDRMQVIRIAGVGILNDAYNANPDSVVAALRTLASIKSKGKKIVVLGDMRELGAASEKEHRKIGIEISPLGFDYLLTHGEQSRFVYDSAAVRSKFHYDQKNILAEYLLELVSPGDLVLIKGSRGMRMEDVVIFLRDRLAIRDGKNQNNGKQ